MFQLTLGIISEMGACLFDRWAIGFMLFLLTTLMAARQTSQPEVQAVNPAIVNVVDDRKGSVVRIRAVASDGSESYGTGFLVTDDGLVLTAANVVSAAKDIEVIRFEKLYPAEILFKGSDGLAILRTDLRGQRLLIATHEPTVNDQVGTIGWETKGGARLSSDVGSVVQVAGSRIYYSRASESRPGFSGGPVINEQGDVIGMHLGKMFGTNSAWALNLRSQFPILKNFGILKEDAPTISQDYSLVVGCDDLDDRSQAVQFNLEPGQRISDANASVVEQFQLTSAKVNVESVSGSIVKVHSLLQGQSRGKLLGFPGIFGVPVGFCASGRASILVRVRIEKTVTQR